MTLVNTSLNLEGPEELDEGWILKESSRSI